jgi:cell division control protein 45
MSIIGLTFQFNTARISRDRYEQYQRIYEDEVARLNARSDSSTPAHDFEGLRPTPELRFTLLRHWSLYDAMVHSSYVASKMAIWREKGRRRLTGLFAKMGYSIPNAQQSFQMVPMKNREELTERLDQFAPEYGLLELSYPSFIRYFGYQRQPVGAADMVESLSALLDVGGRVKLILEMQGAKNGGEWFSGGRVLEIGGLWREEDRKPVPSERREDAEEEPPTKTLSWWVHNFWDAYDALTK